MEEIATQGSAHLGVKQYDNMDSSSQSTVELQVVVWEHCQETFPRLQEAQQEMQEGLEGSS